MDDEERQIADRRLDCSDSPHAFKRRKAESFRHEPDDEHRFRSFMGNTPWLLTHLPIYSWAWFLMPMTSLGLSTLINSQRSIYSFHGLYTIGFVFYFIGLFVILKDSLKKSIQDSEQVMFFAAFWISSYGVVTGGVEFAQPTPGSSLSVTFVAFFWIYFICALLEGFGSHLFLFQGPDHGCHLDNRQMTPAWLLPVLPVILVGVCAGSVANYVTTHEAYSILTAGLFCSSMGFLLSLPMAAIYLHRLFINGFPEPDKRPGMMIAVGPPTYAPLAYMKLAKALPHHYGYFAEHPLAVDIVNTIAFIFAIAIFGMGIFFFFMALGPILRRAHKMSFHLTWYGFIFPTSGSCQRWD
ncbi:hypothetical protein M409DRAFT_23870 [Zasmidium cellare ATCC 36951]|uniref:C4-dicarboxylate transporter/malic acid transport protein n=1 Tax=Zasmidium cellare ATCC 36951 TaxID=1080233 RepID=A0A6A6CED8_ZASCE|nr:uncharacterized protein M409DRAFT_23870 [Zasmidium cellare ATCC 36951]KAF2165574.1 hypothetical protein M409DRAFT_23870 [Zasmidium cellare ATCC 36951]